MVVSPEVSLKEFLLIKISENPFNPRHLCSVLNIKIGNKYEN